MYAIWTLSFLAALLAGASAPKTSPLEHARVTRDAEWLVHVDVEAWNQSTIGRFVMDNAEGLNIEMDEVDDFEEEVGLDPRTDLIAVTAYGWHDDGAERLVVVAVTTAAADEALAKLLQEKEDDVRTDIVDGHEVHVFEHGPRVHLRRADRADRRIAVLAEGETAMQTGLAVLDGRAAALERGGKLNLADPRRGSFLYVAASAFDEWRDIKQASEVLRLSDACVLDVGEHEDHVQAHATVSAETLEDARNISQIIQGILALGRVLTNENGDLAPVRRILDALDVSTEQKRLTVSLRVPTDEAIDALEEIIEEED